MYVCMYYSLQYLVEACRWWCGLLQMVQVEDTSDPSARFSAVIFPTIICMRSWSLWRLMARYVFSKGRPNLIPLRPMVLTSGSSFGRFPCALQLSKSRWRGLFFWRWLTQRTEKVVQFMSGKYWQSIWSVCSILGLFNVLTHQTE